MKKIFTVIGAIVLISIAGGLFDYVSSPFKDIEQPAKAYALTTTSAGVRVTFLNVGQGNATLIRAKGYSALVDFGKSSTTLNAELKKCSGTSYFKYIFVSHPDFDHYNGGFSLISSGRVGKGTTLYIPKSYDSDTTDEYNNGKTWNSLVSSFKRKGVRVVYINDKTTLPSVISSQIDVVWPNASYDSKIDNKNNNSLVLDVSAQHGTKNVLITGDIENSVESVMYSPNFRINNDNNKVNVFQAPHHGSIYSSSPGLLSKIKPACAVISVGKNSYGHPSSITVARLATITKKYSPTKTARVYRTDKAGAITVHLEQNGYTYAPSYK